MLFTDHIEFVAAPSIAAQEVLLKEVHLSLCKLLVNLTNAEGQQQSQSVESMKVVSSDLCLDFLLHLAKQPVRPLWSSRLS